MRGKRNTMTPNEKGMYVGVVYRYINKVESDEFEWCYVGNTTDEKHRKYSWNNHGNKSYGGKKINEARKKYGLENFEYEVLERVEAETVAKLKAQLDEIETTYIKQFNSVEKGYNSSEGGTGNKGGVTEEHRRNIGKASTGRIVSQETRAKISASSIGHEVSEETRAKISKSKTGKKHNPAANKNQSDRMKGKRPVYLIEGKKKWIENGGTLKGYKHTPEAIANMKASQQENGTKIFVTDPNGAKKFYNTMLDASKDLGVNIGSIDYYVNKSKTHKRKDGYYFEKAA